MNYDNLNELLAYLAGPAGALAWFLFVSDLIRNAREGGKLATWNPWQVQLLVLGISLSVPIGALAIVTYIPAASIAQLQDVYAIVAVIAGAYVGQQVFFKWGTKSILAG